MRTYFLDISYAQKMAGALPRGASYSQRLKEFTYEGDALPAEMLPYHSKDYSLLRWKEDQYNRKVYPVTPHGHRFTPRPHQKEAGMKIAQAATQGFRGFIEGDGTGIGKTLSSLVGVYVAMKAKKQRSAKLLVVAPLAAIEGWSNTLKAFPIPNVRVCIVNYEQLQKLLSAPASAKTVKKAKTKKDHLMRSGTPTVKWDYIIADESHKLKNWELAARPKAFGRIAQYQETTGYPFVIWASATIGQNVLELQYLAPILKQVTKDRPNMSWFAWLEKHNFAVRQSKTSGNILHDVPSKKASQVELAEYERRKKADLNRLNSMLFSPQSPSIRRTPTDIAGWPQINRLAQGESLSPMEFVEYQKEWISFQVDYRMQKKSKNPQGALARQIRFRQKSSIIRAPHSIDFIDDLAENGYQVAVYVEFLETADKIRAGLEKKGHKVAEFTGRNVNSRESERITFQRGAKNVIIFNTTEAVSFHAGETLPDGSKASMTPRATVMHDLPYSGIKATQVEGRCHRDGKYATVYYMYAVNTTENKIAHRMIDRIQSIVNIMDDESLVAELDGLLVQE